MTDPLDASLLDEIRSLEEQGHRGRHLLSRLMLRGDWRARTLAQYPDCEEGCRPWDARGGS